MASRALPHPPLRALLELTRPHSASGAALAVWVGGRLAGATWERGWLQPMAVAWLLSAAGNAWNDAHDVAQDRINRPARPIPRGDLSPADARALAHFCLALAHALALPLGWLSLGGTVMGTFLLLRYTTHWKGVPLLGNGVVGLLAGMAMGYGGLLAGDVRAILLPATALGLLFGGREVLKTIPDARGDRSTGTRTVATVRGPRVARLATSLCWLLALGLLAGWATRSPARGLLWGAISVLVAALLLPLWKAGAPGAASAAVLRRSKGLGLLLLLALSLL